MCVIAKPSCLLVFLLYRLSSVLPQSSEAASRAKIRELEDIGHQLRLEAESTTSQLSNLQADKMEAENRADLLEVSCHAHTLPSHALSLRPTRYVLIHVRPHTTVYRGQCIEDSVYLVAKLDDIVPMCVCVRVPVYTTLWS